MVGLNNKTSVAYNDMLAEDDTLVELIVDMSAEIDKNVGEALARAEGSDLADGGDAGSGLIDGLIGAAQMEEAAGDGDGTVVTRVKAIDVVNIRKSDSETADKLGKAAVGDEFDLLEKKGNGWSKISYEGGEAYIKSEFLEPSETQQADAGESAEAGGETQEEEPEAPTEQADNSSSAQTSGTVTVKENVRIRASASENGEKLGTAYVGEKLELIMKQADGWTKVKYNGRTAYVKSDYVE